MNFRANNHDVEAIPVRGRINADKAAHILGFEAHHIPVLILHGLLEPLGKPASNAIKYFALIEILILAEDAKWLHKATRTIYQDSVDKNDKRKPRKAELAVAA